MPFSNSERDREKFEKIAEEHPDAELRETARKLLSEIKNVSA